MAFEMEEILDRVEKAGKYEYVSKMQTVELNEMRNLLTQAKREVGEAQALLNQERLLGDKVIFYLKNQKKADLDVTIKTHVINILRGI